MAGELRQVLSAVRATVADPVIGGQWLMARALTLPQGLMALLAVGCLVALAGGPGGLTLPMPDGMGAIRLGPARYALLFFAVNLGFAAGLTVAGRWLGGQGTFADAAAAVSWLNLVMLALQLLALAVTVLIPAAVALVALALFAAFLWLLFGLVRALHRFDSWPRTVGTVVLAMLLAGLAMSLAITPFLAGSLPDV